MGEFISFAEYHIKNTDKNFLEKYWDWNKNEIDPYKLRHSSGKKVWIKCQNKNYHGSYEITCSQFKRGNRCSLCSHKGGKVHPLDSFAQYHIDNTDKDFLEKYWDYEKNIVDPFEITPNSNLEVWIKCQEKSYHKSYRVSCNHFTGRNSRCPYCHNAIHYSDSLGFLYHDIAKMIVEDERNGLTWEDTYSIAPNSNKYFYFKCNNCGFKKKKKKKVCDIQSFGYPCEYCSDGVSIPEKFVANILNQLNINFTTQYSPDWIDNKRYDFYIPNLNMIIEVHGSQHYEGTIQKKSLKEQQLNDEYKKKKALENNIEKYIIIDCRYSTLDWLKGNVFRELNIYFNLRNVNWDAIWKNCQSSLCIQSWDLWNEGFNRKYISDKLKIHPNTVSRYLKKGKECGMCNYTKEEMRKRGRG